MPPSAPRRIFTPLRAWWNSFAAALGIDDYSFAAGGPEYYHPGRKAVLTIAGKQAGVLGEVHPTAAENYGISERVYLAELELDALFAGIVPERKYRALPRYPAVDRDLAVVLDASVPAGSVAAAIRKAAGKLCEKTELFDVYNRQATCRKGRKAWLTPFACAQRTTLFRKRRSTARCTRSWPRSKKTSEQNSAADGEAVPLEASQNPRQIGRGFCGV